MKTSKEGEQLWHYLVIRVFNVNNDGAITKRFVAGAGRGYTSEGIDKMPDEVADDLDRLRPNDDFELVQIAPNRFNFVWRGKRVPDASQETAEA
jgi:hypothetical protein